MKVILVDDEELALNLLERHLAKISNLDVIGKFVNPSIARDEILKQSVDVVFLDINLPEINGIELGEQILEHKPELALVFVTAYDRYAVEAFELNALDYLVKPLRRDRLMETISRIKSRYPNVSSPSSTNSPLRVSVCGQLTIEKAGIFEPIPWRTTRAQELFLYLLLYKGQLVQKSRMIELLWPDSEGDRAYSQLYTTIYHIRKALSKFENAFQIKNKADGYILRTNHVVLDIEKWEKAIIHGGSVTMETVNTYTEAMELYSGAYIEAYDYIWAEAERHRLEQLWLKTAYEIADLYDEHQDVKKAETWYLKISQQHPYSEEAYFSLMKIYSSLGQHEFVEHQYNQLTLLLGDELNILPTSSIRNWFREWKRTTSY